MKTAEQWAAEWSGMTMDESDAEARTVEFLRRVQRDAIDEMRHRIVFALAASGWGDAAVEALNARSANPDDMLKEAT